jgi:hypothetical protein
MTMVSPLAGPAAFSALPWPASTERRVADYAPGGSLRFNASGRGETHVLCGLVISGLANLGPLVVERQVPVEVLLPAAWIPLSHA